VIGISQPLINVDARADFASSRVLFSNDLSFKSPRSRRAEISLLKFDDGFLARVNVKCGTYAISWPLPLRQSKTHSFVPAQAKEKAETGDVCQHATTRISMSRLKA